MLARKLDRLFDRYRTQDDGHALARVFDLVSSDLYRFALHLCRDGERAEDLVQATFLTAIERRDSYVARGKLFSWLAGILGNEFRRNQRAAGRSIDPGRLAVRRDSDVADTVVERESLEQVQVALAAVPEPYRGVLDLELNESLKAAAIAERLDRPRGTVRAQLTRGRELLRRLLPPGLAGIFVTLFPRQAHASVREAVLTHAGFSATTGAVGVAGLQLAAAAVAVVVLGTAPLLLGEDLPDELDRAVSAAEDAPDENAPRRLAADVASPPATAGFSATASAVSAPADDPGHWRWRLRSPTAHGPSGVKGAESLRVADLPAAWGPRQFDLRSDPSLPHSLIEKASTFGPLIPAASLADGVAGLAGPPRDRVARVFYAGLEWGAHRVLALENSLRPGSGWHAPAGYAERFSITFDKSHSPGSPPLAVLFGRDGVVRKAFHRDGKSWVLDVAAPLPLEVEIPMDDGLVFTAMLQKANAKLSLRDVAKDHGARVDLVEAESGAAVAGATVHLCTTVRHGPSVALIESETGTFSIPERTPEPANAAVLVSAPGRLTQFLKLKGLGKGRPAVYTVPMLPASRGRGLLISHDGEPIPRACVRFRDVKWGIEMLEAFSDDGGRLDWIAVESRRGGGVRAAALDDAVEGHVETADGRRGRVAPIAIRALLSGATIRLDREREDVELVVVDADGRSVPRAGVSVSIPGEHDGRLHAFGSTHHETDDAGVCSVGTVFGERIRVVVAAPGRLRETHDADVPHGGAVEIRLAPTRPITVVLDADVADIDLSKCTQASITAPGADGLHSLESFDAAGRMSVEAPMGETYTVKLNLAHGARHDGVVLVAERDEFTGVAPGTILRPRITVSHGVRFDVLGRDGKRLRSALVLLEGDDPPDVRPWEHRGRGFGGAWAHGYPINLPLGSPTVTFVAPGHVPRRMTLSVRLEDRAVVEVRLEPGVVLSGSVSGDTPIHGFALEPVALDGVVLQPKWFESHEVSSRIYVRVSSDGAFRSDPVTPGRYRATDRGKVLEVLDLRTDRDDVILEVGR